MGGRAPPGGVPACFPRRESGRPGEFTTRDVPVAGLHDDGRERVLEARVEGFVVANGVRLAAVRLARSDGRRWAPIGAHCGRWGIRLVDLLL